MRSFYKILIVIIILFLAMLIGSNAYISWMEQGKTGRPYRVEISRLVHAIEEQRIENIDLSEYEYITNVELYSGNETAFFEETDSDYVIRQIDGELYRLEYRYTWESLSQIRMIMNLMLGICLLVMLGILLYIRRSILKPFETLREVPYQLSKGNLNVPIQENKSRYFGRFVWGVDLLREHMEEQKVRELELQKEKSTLLLSISHDIKTPLSAIKLYAQALSKGLYSDKEKQGEIAEHINTKADEIEGFVSQIVKASSEDFLKLEVNNGEFYLSELIHQISGYYKEKLELIKIDFRVGAYSDCILKGDLDRSVEVLQNIIENAIKYGDGHTIELLYSEEENCRLLTVKNSGCTLPEIELPHIFDSFWRGSNAGNSKGSGLGLYICRQLMQKMDGEIYAEKRDREMWVTVVFEKV